MNAQLRLEVRAVLGGWEWHKRGKGRAQDVRE